MTTAIAPSDQDTQPLEPSDRRWTRDEYYRLAEQGYFDGQHVELIDGRVILMPPQGNNHDVAVSLCQELLLRLSTDGYWVRAQMSLDLSPIFAPEPDIAVVQAVKRNNILKPRTALLVVEVSETTLKYDETVKQRIYASNGIPEYWIINLKAWHLEVYRDPIAEPQEQFTHHYGGQKILTAKDSVSPLALPTASISVADLFPSVRNAK